MALTGNERCLVTGISPTGGLAASQESVTTQDIANLSPGGSAPPGTSALIASAISVDLNAAGDTAMTLSAFATGNFFVVEWCIATNADAVLTTVQAGIFSGAGATGQIYGGNGTLPLTDPRDWQTIPGSNTLSGGSLSTMQNTVPFVNVGTPEGAPATADFYVYGRVFP